MSASPGPDSPPSRGPSLRQRRHRPYAFCLARPLRGSRPSHSANFWPQRAATPTGHGYCANDPVNRVDAWGLEGSALFDFGGDGRSPADGPKYGNFCGKNWTGGWNPEQHGGKPGPLGSVDTLDEKCRRHDFCWSDSVGTPDVEQSKRQCDEELVDKLKALPKDSSQWERQPPPGKEEQAEAMRKGAIWWFDQ